MREEHNAGYGKKNRTGSGAETVRDSWEANSFPRRDQQNNPTPCVTASAGLCPDSTFLLSLWTSLVQSKHIAAESFYKGRETSWCHCGSGTMLSAHHMEVGWPWVRSELGFPKGCRHKHKIIDLHGLKDGARAHAACAVSWASCRSQSSVVGVDWKTTFDGCPHLFAKSELGRGEEEDSMVWKGLS